MFGFKNKRIDVNSIDDACNMSKKEINETLDLYNKDSKLPTPARRILMPKCKSPKEEFKYLEELIQLDEALTSLGKSDSSVEYAAHIRDEFDNVIDKLNKLKVTMGYERFVNNSDEYFLDED